MTFHRIGKNKAKMNVTVTATCGGAWKPATLCQWIEPGLKNGRKIIAVSGNMDQMPNTVAKAAPSLMPNQAGMKIIASTAKQTSTIVIPIGAPQVVPTGEMRCPGLKPKSTAGRDAAGIRLSGAPGTQRSQ